MSHQHNRMCAHPPRWTLVTSLPISLLLFCGAQCGSSLETVDLSAIELATVNKDSRINKLNDCRLPCR